ncbi:podoplanin isoform X2 [Microcaecilia unicolor]|uniref:Podoplanin isoform X2 n=1 Tax=Microcaecilia unicolor TaxID=1415580 RepID=A0A6P7ZF49_9AMPH|nr:podoplanin isoform X2 [Microcaecilia unicolor]
MFKLNFLTFLLTSQCYSALAEEGTTVQGETSDPTKDVSVSNKLPTQLPGIEKETELGYSPFTEELMTTESEILTKLSHVNSTDDGVKIQNFEGSLGTGAIIGIIAGVITLVGLLASIIMIAVRKMSGRYTPY